MIFRRLQRFLDWLATRSNLVLVAMLVVVAGTWIFISILDEVREGGADRFDRAAILYLKDHHGPQWVQEVARDFTALGGVAVLALVTLAVVGFLLISRKYGAMWLVIVATGGGLVITTVLKRLIDRDRPQLIPWGSMVYTQSFPSGHSMLSAVTYLTLGSLLARLVQGRWLKLYFLAVAIMLTFLVGVSRVYLGVHWPTDVLAGWSAGLAWALLCWIVARELQRRGAVERDDDPRLLHDGSTPIVGDVKP